MKFSSIFLLCFSFGLVSANLLKEKRASISDRATIGYATLSGGTTGGGSASPIIVATLDELKVAIYGTSAKVVIVSGSITGNEVVVIGSNTSVIGKSGATLNGIGLRVVNASNVIIRNLKINRVLADTGDHIGVQASNRIWIDSVELWSDRDHDKDYYDGLLDIANGVYAMSITNSYLHDHWKGSSAGYSNSGDSGGNATQVTYAFNKWENLNSRTPSFRSGQGHIFCNYFLNNNGGINSQTGARLLIENNVFENMGSSTYRTEGGCIDAAGNIPIGMPVYSVTPCSMWFNLSPDLSNSESAALPTFPGGITLPDPYNYLLIPATSVKAYVNRQAGANLSF
ncbi:Pectate lyase, partial [Rhizoctonia solani]